MCPLRFILVFFSAVLAGYFAWKTVSSSDEPPQASIQQNTSATATEKQEQFHFLKTIQNGFWVFIDMASGRYLWRNIKQLNSSHEDAKAT
ncbi:hypothetical protein CDL12_06887 [Handroanthus impetiginosus]|uniref:Methyltransferase n=1 Tax=Handroanthus impetiginosus TaxID=429701 RepID=A0A2G9HSC6_9LAMI|nr:hypothetical protein CDL12_06887 [Handroanthus impetiginosus]